jgi:threonine dehydrogenase-like Zn-dependent dehydrogenase
MTSLVTETIKAPAHPDIKFPIVEPRWDPVRKMKAIQWQGASDVRVCDVPRPMITEPKDAIVRITATTICGSDLHLYHGEPTGSMHKGDILGHECMGIVDAVGDQVKDIKVGDRVVVSAVIAEGNCEYCQRQQFSLCECTNPSKEMEEMYGHRLSGVLGYSHFTGGYPGGQAEFVRVPFADVNLLKVPPDMPDEKVLFLSDIVCTGWHANELGGVSEGQTVAVWGCGPVGLMALSWAKFRGAAKIIAIDPLDYRLEVARRVLGAHVINPTKEKTLEVLKLMAPGGPDVCIEAAGFRYSKGYLHTVQRALGLESDTPEILTEAILACKKGGNLSIIGDYFALTNNFPIGALMEKNITTRGGQVFIQKYWKKLLGYIREGKFDPTFVITHRFSMDELARAYDMFDKKEDKVIKVIITPSASTSTATY